MWSTILFSTLLWIAYIKQECLAESLEVKSVDEMVSDELEEGKYKEERKLPYLTNNQMRNKFIRQYNQIVVLQNRLQAIEDTNVSLDSLKTDVSTAESTISGIQSNEKDIDESLDNNCKQLDYVLDSDSVDCCKTDYVVICLERSSMILFDSSFDTTKGNCPTCPDGVEGLQ